MSIMKILAVFNQFFQHRYFIISCHEHIHNTFMSSFLQNWFVTICVYEQLYVFSWTTSCLFMTRYMWLIPHTILCTEMSSPVKICMYFTYCLSQSNCKCQGCIFCMEILFLNPLHAVIVKWMCPYLKSETAHCQVQGYQDKTVIFNNQQHIAWPDCKYKCVWRQVCFYTDAKGFLKWPHLLLGLQCN